MPEIEAETTERDLVEQVEELLNDPKWSEPFGGDARRLLTALSNQNAALREQLAEAQTKIKELNNEIAKTSWQVDV